MSAKSFAWRAGAFVRSVLPAEPAHWLILLGSTLLFISAGLPWWQDSMPYGWLGWVTTQRTVRIYCLARLLVVSGAASFYLTLVPRKSRSGLPFYFVYVPASVMVVVMLSFGFVAVTGRSEQGSVIAQVTDPAYLVRRNTFKSLATGFGPGLWIAVLGLVLVTIFCLRLRRGRATLPLRLPPRDAATGSVSFEVDDIGQRKTMRFVWAAISLVPAVSLAAAVPAGFFYMLLTRAFVHAHPRSILWTNELSFSLGFFLLIILAMGRDAWRSVRESFRLPPLTYVGV
jgi:hypothetical protein